MSLAGPALDLMKRTGRAGKGLGITDEAVSRWEDDLERGYKIAREMKRRGYSAKEIAEWLAANSARALGRLQRRNDGLDDTLPQYPAPWQR